MADPSSGWISLSHAPLPSLKIPGFVACCGSSEGDAIADDALKDADNAAWLLYFSAEVRQTWTERIHWIRSVDRLAERDWLDSDQGGHARFQEFRRHWNLARCGRQIPKDSPHRLQLERMIQVWRDDSSHNGSQRRLPSPNSHFGLQAWQRYLQALDTYHCHNLQLTDLAEYDEMIDRLGGSLFQVLPDLTPELAAGARAFGILDQCYNHLRDLYEDTQSGLCYFPQAVLDRFGLKSEDFTQLEVFDRPSYDDLMAFWCGEYLPGKWEPAREFAARDDLPETWRYLCDWSLDRYERIEASLRRCNYDYLDFARDYWGDVRQRLLGRPAIVQTPKTCV